MFKPEEIQGFTQLFLKDVITVSDGITHANMSAGLFVFIHIWYECLFAPNSLVTSLYISCNVQCLFELTQQRL